MVRRTLNRACDVTHRGRNTFSTSRLAVSAAGPAKPKGRRNAQPEAALQKTVVQALALMGIDGMWFAVPNGGARSKIEAAILKGMGVKPGVADLCLIWHLPTITRMPGFGFIELKAPGARLEPSESQAIFKADCERLGVPYAIAQSIEGVDAILADWNVPRRRNAAGRFTPTPSSRRGIASRRPSG